LYDANGERDSDEGGSFNLDKEIKEYKKKRRNRNKP
jgi:hypothetical protein